MAESSNSTPQHDGQQCCTIQLDDAPSFKWEAMMYDLIVERMNREAAKAEVKELKNIISILLQNKVA